MTSNGRPAEAPEAAGAATSVSGAAARAPSGSLRVRILAGSLGPLILALILQAGYTVAAQRAAMIRGLEDKARSLASLMVNVAGPSLALDDPDGVADGLAYVEHDPDFGFVLATGADGKAVGYRGPPDLMGAHLQRARSIRAPLLMTEPKDASAQGLLLARVPVVSQGKHLGTILLGLRTGAIHAQVIRMTLLAASISLGGVGLAVLVVMLLAGKIAQRNQDMKLLLDSVDQGFLIALPDGSLMAERSATAQQWFGPPRPGQRLWEAFATVNRDTAEWLDLAWGNLNGDMLPLLFSLDQLPKRLAAGATTFRVDYKPIQRGQVLEQVLVVITDITAEIRRERAEGFERDLVHVLDWLTRDRRGLLQFFDEANHLVDRIVARNDGDPRRHGTLARDLHTLKGICGVFGLTTMVGVCHQIEERFRQAEPTLDEASRRQLTDCWTSFKSRIVFITGGRVATTVEVNLDEYQRALLALEQKPDSASLAALVRSWRMEPTDLRLRRAAEQARQLAERLGKGELDITITSNELRLPPERWSSFWSAFTHVIRNAVDHGLEDRETRVAQGKPPRPGLWLRTIRRDGTFVIELEDDGRGIDWDAVAARAAERGLPHATAEERLQTLFSRGFTTRTEVTEISGRGIGLAAVRVECEALGGRVDVASTPRRGTVFSFVWPEHAVNVGSGPDTRGGPLAASSVA
jgi:two-component system, chemotaxis family, sensor kinase CheA